MAEKDNAFTVKIITPDRVFFEGNAEMLEFTTTEGEIGIYKDHIPLTTVLAPGIVTITVSGEEKKYAAVYSGFAEILGDQVTLLAEAAEWPGEIDLERAQAAEKRARERLASKDTELDIARCELALRRSLVRQDLKSMQ